MVHSELSRSGDRKERGIKVRILINQQNKLRGRAEVACKAHNLEVAGSSPAPATKCCSFENGIKTRWLVNPVLEISYNTKDFSPLLLPCRIMAVHSTLTRGVLVRIQPGQQKNGLACTKARRFSFARRVWWVRFSPGPQWVRDTQQSFIQDSFNNGWG